MWKLESSAAQLVWCAQRVTKQHKLLSNLLSQCFSRIVKFSHKAIIQNQCKVYHHYVSVLSSPFAIVATYENEPNPSISCIYALHEVRRMEIFSN